MTDEQKKLFDIWKSDLQLITWSHYEAASKMDAKNYILGVFVIALTAIVGTSVFATLAEEPHFWAKIIVGLISLLATILSAMQTFLRFSERAQIHRKSGAKFGSLLAEIEQINAFSFEDNKKIKEWCSEFRKRWDHLGLESPTVPPSIWRKNRKKIKKQENT